MFAFFNRLFIYFFILVHRPNRLTQCYVQFKSPRVKILCVLCLHYDKAFIFKVALYTILQRFEYDICINNFSLAKCLSHSTR